MSRRDKLKKGQKSEANYINTNNFIDIAIENQIGLNKEKFNTLNCHEKLSLNNSQCIITNSFSNVSNPNKNHSFVIEEELNEIKKTQIFVISKIKKINNWTKEEDQKLLNLVEHYPERDWKLISNFLPGKTGIQCSSRYRRIRPGLNKGYWTKEEDQKLFGLYKIFGKNWKMIAMNIENRSGKQIRDRFLNSLDPSLDKKKFTKKEDKRILFLYKKFGAAWSKISKHFQGRSGDMIKNRFYSFFRANKRLFSQTFKLKKRIFLNKNDKGSNNISDAASQCNLELIKLNKVEGKNYEDCLVGEKIHHFTRNNFKKNLINNPKIFNNDMHNFHDNTKNVIPNLPNLSKEKKLKRKNNFNCEYTNNNIYFNPRIVKKHASAENNLIDLIMKDSDKEKNIGLDTVSVHKEENLTYQERHFSPIKENININLNFNINLNNNTSHINNNDSNHNNITNKKEYNEEVCNNPSQKININKTHISDSINFSNYGFNNDNYLIKEELFKIYSSTNNKIDLLDLNVEKKLLSIIEKEFKPTFLNITYFLNNKRKNEKYFFSQIFDILCNEFFVSNNLYFDLSIKKNSYYINNVIMKGKAINETENRTLHDNNNINPCIPYEENLFSDNDNPENFSILISNLFINDIIYNTNFTSQEKLLVVNKIKNINSDFYKFVFGKIFEQIIMEFSQI